MQLSKPHMVSLAESCDPSMDELAIVRTLTQWNLSTQKVSRLARNLLEAFDGYECKEPEPGRFTLAFP